MTEIFHRWSARIAKRRNGARFWKVWGDKKVRALFGRHYDIHGCERDGVQAFHWDVAAGVEGWGRLFLMIVLMCTWGLAV